MQDELRLFSSIFLLFRILDQISAFSSSIIIDDFGIYLFLYFHFSPYIIFHIIFLFTVFVLVCSFPLFFTFLREQKRISSNSSIRSMIGRGHTFLSIPMRQNIFCMFQIDIICGHNASIIFQGLFHSHQKKTCLFFRTMANAFGAGQKNVSRWRSPDTLLVRHI